jgi:hypothetical protein
MLTSEKMLCKDYDNKGLFAKRRGGGEYTGFGPQGAWCQDKLIGGKPPVVK